MLNKIKDKNVIYKCYIKFRKHCDEMGYMEGICLLTQMPLAAMVIWTINFSEIKLVF